MVRVATMPRLSIALLLIPLLLGFALALPAGAAPRFTDKDNALELAKVLDKGVFRGNLISSTFVHSPETGEYQIKVVLDNGSELNWNLHQIRLWSQDNSLTLSRNRALIFPDLDTNTHGILDKNEFTRLALRARVFAKHYKGSDILAGKVIHYAVHSFNLVDLLQVTPGTDEYGYQYRYVMDLENGQRELLSYLDAWEALRQNALQESAGSAPVMRRTYLLRGIESTPLERIPEAGAGRFSLQMIFDRTIQLAPGHFPFRFYEGRAGKGKEALDNRFIFEVTAPNAQMVQPGNTLDAAEYLYRVHAVNDDKNQNRTLLRARIAPEALTDPPTVSVNENRVVITFVKMDDLSVFDRKALREAELRRRQEKMLAPVLTPDDIERRRLYRQHMETGLGQLDAARARTDLNDRYETILASLANFKEAAIHASSDQELEEALRQRNEITRRLPRQVIALANAVVDGKVQADSGRARALVRAMLGVTQDEKVLAELKAAETRLGGK